MTLLTVSGVTKKIDKEVILDNIEFSQQRLQNIAIAGETGSGKSTLLKTIAGLSQPDKGDVLLDGEHVPGPEEKLVPGHPHISYLSQHFELQKFLRVEQVLEYANTLSDEEAHHLFDVCRITHLLKRKTDQLSGGEKQRIALANLLLTSPTLLLLDEPFSNLDRLHKTILQSVIDDISTRLKITIILVSHDPGDILSWADKVIVLRDGKILQKGTPEKIYHYPGDEYTAGIFGKYVTLSLAHRKALSGLPGIKVVKKGSFLRPEHFRFVSRKKNAITGKVKEVNFFGSHYEVEVEAEGSIITVNCAEPVMESGDTVYVSLSASYIAGHSM